uniref:G-type lectin S-receptor-like serine/threonine-protein kinase At2g19130 n=1 Tax=Erigeron canadensis TaxID=72917 RepID=UPI001CB8B6D1|nr:G-type lectin S-receptor-like serine/threonine-protein kinase At2g19130 [Erigeron canadensis]
MIIIITQLLVIFLILPVSYGAEYTLTVNQSLSGDQTIISEGERFELGFFKPGQSSKYYIGIWYKKESTSTYRYVVWVANRETPISNRYKSNLKIIGGNLVLLNESKTQIWSTNLNTNATSPASLVLLDEGNLVLRYGSSLSPPVWQSFDHPTDTFLPGSKFGYNRRTNTTQVLTSWRSWEDPGMGLYSLEFDHTEKQYVLKWNNSVQYWTSGPWNDEHKAFPQMTLDGMYYLSRIDNENESYFTFSSYPGIKSSLWIDVSGMIKLETSPGSELSWSQPREQCQVYPRCDVFGVCNSESWPSCKCLTAFTPTSKRNWILNDYSGGCMRKTELNCSVKEKKVEFILSYALVEHLSFLENETLAMDESACRRSCLDDCTCDAFSFIFKTCQLWRNTLVFVADDPNRKTFLFNIKVASKDLVSPMTNIRGKKNKSNLGVVVGSVVGVIFVLGLILFIFRMKEKIFVGKTTMMGSLMVFVYRDLQIATKNFSDRLGNGGFGSVFKGVLHDSSIVAVKRLESISQGDKEFRSEISTIGNIQHVNLVHLCGFCAEGDRKLLVYEYMPNGSLHSNLFHQKQDNVLNWNVRYQIAIGTAKGLVYLHEKCRDCIIHCDIKPENILLDANFCPKIADFGLAKLVGRDFSKVLTTMRGTRGYLAPEWLSGVPVTAKVDVFSYGMMLFELVHGKRNAELSEDMCFTFFPSLAANIVISGGDILSLLDTRLNREANVEEVTRICKVAYWCIQDDEDSRPSMSQVEQILEGVSDVKMPPIPQSFQFLADDSEDFLFFDELPSTGLTSADIKSHC